MAVIALLSAKGAPGCSTAALGLALRWPAASVLVEADLSGSSVLAGYLRGELYQTKGLVEVAAAAIQSGRLDLDTVMAQCLALERSTPTAATTLVLPGIATLAQGAAVRTLWGELGAALTSLQNGGADALVDVGRLGVLSEDRHPLLARCDLLAVVTGSGLPQIHATQQLVQHLQSRYTGADSQLSPLGLVVVGPGRPYSDTEIAQACGLRLLGSLPWDPDTAEVYSAGAGTGRKPDARPLNRGLTVLAQALHEAALSRREELSGKPRGGQ